MALCILRYFIIMLFINNDIIVDTILVGSQNEEANLQKTNKEAKNYLAMAITVAPRGVGALMGERKYYKKVDEAKRV